MAVLLLDHAERVERTAARVRAALARPLEIGCCTVDEEAVQLLTGWRSSGVPAVVLIGPGHPAPVPMARRIVGVSPDASLLVVADGDGEALQRRFSSPLAMVGTRWSVTDLASDGLGDAIDQACRRAARTTSLQATLGRINRTLGSGGTTSLSELSRYTTSHRFLANVLRHARDAMVATTLEGVVVAWNLAAEEMFGVSESDAVGRGVRAVVDPEVGAEIASLLSRADGAPDRTARGTLVLEDGERGAARHLDLTVGRVGGREEDPAGWSIVVRDVSEGEALRENLERARRFESLGVVAGGVAHDFNNILMGITGHAELVEKALPAGSVERSYVQSILDSGQRAAVLCRQMLTFAGRQPAATRPVDLDAVVKSAARDFEAREGAEHPLRLELHGALPPVQGDTAGLRQLLENLITNAVEATPEPDEILIRTGIEVPDSPVHGEVDRDGGGPVGAPRVVLEVVDRGTGMPPGVAERAFEPFFSTRFTGRGLGLAEVLGIARSHEGGVSLTSAPGEGTTVRVWLPCRTEGEGGGAGPEGA